MKQLLVAVSVVFACFWGSNQAYSDSNYQGPYGRRPSSANVAQRIVNILDNATVGSIQTVLGASHVVYYLIMNPINGGEMGVDMETHHNDQSEVDQIIINEPSLAGRNTAYSLGLFQVGLHSRDHEGGHAVASASLGPLYLPTVGLSYLLEGHSNSFLEDWADLEANPNDYAWTNQVQVGAGMTNYEGEQRTVLVIKFSLDQTQRNEDNNLIESKFYRWFNSEILIPLADRTREANFSPSARPCNDLHPFEFNFAVLTKDMELVIDNLSLDLEGDHELRSFLRTRQAYVSIENPGRSLLFLHPLTWQAQFGIEYSNTSNFKVRLSAGGTVNTSVFSPGRYTFGSDLRFEAAGGIIAQMDVDFFDFIRVSNTIQKEWGSDGSERFQYSSQITNEFRNPVEDFGWLHSIEISGGYRHDSIEFDDVVVLNNNRFDLSMGIRF